MPSGQRQHHPPVTLSAVLFQDTGLLQMSAACIFPFRFTPLLLLSWLGNRRSAAAPIYLLSANHEAVLTSTWQVQALPSCPISSTFRFSVNTARAQGMWLPVAPWCRGGEEGNPTDSWKLGEAQTPAYFLTRSWVRGCDSFTTQLTH